MAQSVRHPYRSAFPKFVLKEGSELFTDQAGLSLVGLALEKFARVRQTLDKALPKRSGLSVGEIVLAYVGLLSQGKSDFDAIENHRKDGFFADALGISGVPAASTLRMQLDALGDKLLPLTDELSVSLLKQSGAPITPLPCGLVPLDIDVFGMDNSRTRKEGVSRTYGGFDGYVPIAGYLGQEGYCLGLELREGVQHSAKETEYTLERVLPRAMGLIAAAIVARLDSGFHSARLMHEIESASTSRKAAGGQAVHFLIKGNPRGRNLQALHADRIETQAIACLPREGKRVWLWETQETCVHEKHAFQLRRIHRLIERTLHVQGQALLVPELEYDFWETTLPASYRPIQVIRLYEDHGTHEQFHSEFKTDLDLERLPSGKFATNDLILSLSMLAYNVLRLIGQSALLSEDAPVRHSAKRRRLKTVIQEIINVSAKVVVHARKRILNFGRHCPAFSVFQRLHGQWSTA
jgi:hypothetical protein